MTNGDLINRRIAATGPRTGRGLGIALVDQVPLFRDGLQSLVANTPGLRWLGSTQNVHAAVVMCERFRPDVVLIDSVLDPRGHLARMLSGAVPSLAVVSLVREPHRTAHYVSDAVGSGLNGVLLRSAEPSQYIEAIRRTHSERRYLDPALSVLATGVDTRGRPTVRQPLSRREYQVLQLIADGMENQAIGKALFVSVETVRTHVKSILRKLHARDRAHAVAVAFRIGALVPHGKDTVATGEQVPVGPTERST